MKGLEKELSKKTLEQRRADAALTAVQGWNPHWRSHAAQRVKELPLMIRNNGLGQVLAVLTKESGGGKDPEKKNNNEKASEALLNALTQWLLTRSPVKAYPTVDGNKPENLLKACFNGTRAQYQLAQQEAIAFLGWVKLMAEAVIQTEAQDGAQRR